MNQKVLLAMHDNNLQKAAKGADIATDSRLERDRKPDSREEQR